MKAEVRVPAQLPYGEMDLCIILANTLENAIRACWEVPQDKRLLRLKLELTDNQRLTLFVENACSQLVTFGPDGLPVTSQSDSEHGLGLRSVQGVARRHRGLMRCQCEEGKFLLWVALFPREQQGD